MYLLHFLLIQISDFPVKSCYQSLCDNKRENYYDEIYKNLYHDTQPHAVLLPLDDDGEFLIS